MAYDEKLAQRVREAIGSLGKITERNMFGGLAFMAGGRMFCGIVRDDFMVRVGPDRYGEALSRPHVRPMDFTGRPMKGYVYVGPAGCDSAEALAAWVEWGAEFVATLDDAGKTRRGHKKQARRPGRSR